ncbi:hypothetical protein WA158_001423 [Blastocystis sp. Blastoise]
MKDHGRIINLFPKETYSDKLIVVASQILSYSDVSINIWFTNYFLVLIWFSNEIEQLFSPSKNYFLFVFSHTIIHSLNRNGMFIRIYNDVIVVILAARPVVSVYSIASEKVSQLPLPEVFTAPIRTDIIHFVHTNVAKNHRQPYAVFARAGMQHSAESWGTGRAVARVPRISGGGTNRSGQGAFANMCRKGRMFAPTKIWRRWHRHVNVNQRRYAIVSALAASAVPALVMARGHNIQNVHEIPLVVDSEVTKFTKTKEAAAFLKSIGAYADIERVCDTKHIRAGQGKARNRRYVTRVGPMVVYKDEHCTKAFRNLAGVTLCNVNRLNILSLCPGGHVGRFIIWTKSAFEALDSLYGTESKKVGYTLPKGLMSTADVSRIINSVEVQSVVRPAKKNVNYLPKVNPLTNKEAMDRLNPYAAVFKAAETKANAENKANKKENMKKKRAASKKQAAESRKYYRSMMA